MPQTALASGGLFFGRAKEFGVAAARRHSHYWASRECGARLRLRRCAKMAEANGFTASRVPAGDAAAATPPSHRPRRAQLNFKVMPETLAQFTAIADREKWLLAETLEHALDALTG
jgi:hypothetical protein